MVDKAFRAALRNFSTLFLLVAVVTVPLHLAYSVVFANVIETRELHDVIETFPEARQVRGVGRAQLTHARLGLGIVTLIELAALPFLARGTRRVLRREQDGEIPTVGDALRSLAETPGTRLDRRSLGPVLVATVVALVLGLSVERLGLLLIELVPDERSYPFFGLMQAISRALGAPFLLVTLIHAGRPSGDPGTAVPDVY